MAIDPILIPELERLVVDIVHENYSKLSIDGRIGRLTVKEVKQAIEDYGRTIIYLPKEAFTVSNQYPLTSNPSIICIDLTLWTKEEGESDLTLQVEATVVAHTVTVKIMDIHVL